MVHPLYYRFLWLFITISIFSCSQQQSKPWYSAIPNDLPALITVEEGTSLTEVVEKPFIPVFDDISRSAIPLIRELNLNGQINIEIKAMLLFPNINTDLQPVWIGKASAGILKRLADTYHKRFTQNYYEFNGQQIRKLFIGDRVIFASQIDQWLFFSEYSFGLEESLRAYVGLKPSMEKSDMLFSKSGLILNTPYLQNWIRQLVKVGYYPAFENILKGTKPAYFSVQNRIGSGLNLEYIFEGTIPLAKDSASALTEAFSYQNSPLVLDQYISDNAASFAILRSAPPPLPADTSGNLTSLDSLLLNTPELYTEFKNTLENEFAFVSFDESGFLSEGEELYLRYLNDFQKFYRLLKRLEQDGYIKQDDNIFNVRSRILAQLIGSPLCNLTEFWVTNAYKAAVVASRKGRVESVKADRSRRRVIYYEDSYLSLRNSLPEEVSGLVFANSKRFMNYLQPFLAENHYLNTLLARFDFLSMRFVRNRNPATVNVRIKTHNFEQSLQPYEERWIFPLDGADLSAEPTLANIGGSSRDELIFAVSSGKVYALATDGTTVMQTNTNLDTPVGSPIVYDWYGNSQDAIIQAAGNKIYAWSDVGEPLPQFPLVLPEKISAPAVIADVTRDGIPELIVATNDRKVHVLNGRGENIKGWPRSVNTPVKSAPVFERIEGSWAITAFSGNALHCWQPDGTIRKGFPIFANASFNGSPLIYNGQILGNAADGHLYSVGTKPIFRDSLNVLSSPGSKDSLVTEAVNVSNSALQGTPHIQTITMRSESDSTDITASMILTMSSNGSVFLLTEAGELRFTQSMGQPAAENFSAFTVDLQNNNRKDIIALANFGRIYAWEAYSGERMFMLPTTGMSFPVFTDFEGDGTIELIAQTREGLRTWTLNN